MKSSKLWIEYFLGNSTRQRIDWGTAPAISENEISVILKSLQAWQLGETSDGSNLLRAAVLHAERTGDPELVPAMKWFIKEEQKHGNNLGRYLDLIRRPRIRRNWGDSLFRKVRHFNTSMEMWTLAVIAVESAAQIYYQALKTATGCPLLKQICTDILIDEAPHLVFQTERMALIFSMKSFLGKWVRRFGYAVFFFGTALVVWAAHKKLFLAGGIDFEKYLLKMGFQYFRTLFRAGFSEMEGGSALVELRSGVQ